MHVARAQLCRQTVAFPIEQQERVIAGGLEVIVGRAILLLTVHRNLGRFHIRHDPLLRIAVSQSGAG